MQNSNKKLIGQTIRKFLKSVNGLFLPQDTLFSAPFIYLPHRRKAFRSTDPLLRGLVLWWNCNENTGTTTTDYSGLGNTGTFGGANAPTWGAGKTSYGIVFGGTSGYVQGTNLAFSTSQALTLSAWIKLALDSVNAFNSFPIICTNYVYIHVRGDGSTTNNVVIRYDTLNATVYNIGYGNRDWHHVLGTFNGDKTLTLWVDGSQRDSDTNAAAPTAARTYTPSIGNLERSIENSFNGTIDDVRIWNRVLTSNEIAAVYANPV
jgi:hypothetical protein